MTIENITQFDNLLDSVIKNHDKLKSNIFDLYSYAVNHAIQSGDWSVLARLFVKLLKNKICSPVHLANVLKNTNPNLTFYVVKERIKQKDGFDKNATCVCDFWSFTESEKKMQAAFDDEKLLASIKNLIKKALKNNIEKSVIQEKFTLAINEK